MSLTFINANYSCSVYCMLCMCMDLRSLQLFCLIIWEFSKIHCFVCKFSSLVKVGKILLSHFVMSLNKCLEVAPCHLDWSWFEGLLHKVLNWINIPLSRSIASMAWDVWGFRVVSFRWDFKSWFVWVNSKESAEGCNTRLNSSRRDFLAVFWTEECWYLIQRRAVFSSFFSWKAEFLSVCLKKSGWVTLHFF